MEEVSQTEMYRAGAYREQILTPSPPRRDRGGAGALPHQEARAGETPEQEAAALAESVANEDETERPRAPTRSPASPTSPTAASAAATRPLTAYDDDTTDLSYTCTSCGFDGVTNLSTDRRAASWSGRSTGRCAGPSRASTSSPPASTTRRPARRTPSARSWCRRSSAAARRPSSATPSSVAGVQKMSSSARRRADRGRRAADPRGADPALALRPPHPQAGLQHRLRSRGGPALRRVGRARPQGRRPRQARRATLACDRASATAAAGPLPTRAVVVPFRTLSSVADVTAGSAELISRIVGTSGFPHDSVADLEPRLTKAMHGPPSRAGRRADHGARDAGRRAARRR